MLNAFTTETQTATSRRVISELYAAREFTTVRDYCAASLRHLLAEQPVGPAADYRAALASHGYETLEIEAATAHMEMFDELRFATVNGVEMWFSNVTL